MYFFYYFFETFRELVFSTNRLKRRKIVCWSPTEIQSTEDQHGLFQSSLRVGVPAVYIVYIYYVWRWLGLNLTTSSSGMDRLIPQVLIDSCHEFWHTLAKGTWSFASEGCETRADLFGSSGSDFVADKISDIMTASGLSKNWMFSHP